MLRKSQVNVLMQPLTQMAAAWFPESFNSRRDPSVSESCLLPHTRASGFRQGSERRVNCGFPARPRPPARPSETTSMLIMCPVSRPSTKKKRPTVRPGASPGRPAPAENALNADPACCSARPGSHTGNNPVLPPSARWGLRSNFCGRLPGHSRSQCLPADAHRGR